MGRTWGGIVEGAFDVEVSVLLPPSAQGPWQGTSRHLGRSAWRLASRSYALFRSSGVGHRLRRECLLGRTDVQLLGNAFHIPFGTDMDGAVVWPSLADFEAAAAMGEEAEIPGPVTPRRGPAPTTPLGAFPGFGRGLSGPE